MNGWRRTPSKSARRLAERRSALLLLLIGLAPLLACKGGSSSKPLLTRANLSLKRVRKSKPSIHLKDLGYAETRHEPAWRAIDAVAAYTGWDHPALGQLAKQVERRDTAWFEGAEALIEEQLFRLPKGSQARLETPSIEAWDPHVDCSSAATQAVCTLSVLVQQRANPTPLSAKLIDAQGVEQSAQIIESVDVEDATVPSGFRRQRWKIRIPEGRPCASYPGPAGVNQGARIRILELCSRRPRCWLRLD